MRVVCVDDDPIFLAIVAEFLAALNLQVVAAFDDPVVALRAIEAGQADADLFLLDLEMPGMTGAQLCAALRALPEHQMTPIIMISSVTERARVKEALEAGANDFLHKPLENVELGARLSMVERILHERSQSAALRDEIGSLRAKPGFGFGFEDAVLPNAEEGLVDYLVLENHLEELGWSGLPGTVVICFRLRNALWAFGHLERLDYYDFLAEAAELILDALPAAQYRLAYAGSGDFIAVLDRGSHVDPVELQLAVQAARGSMWEAYRSLDIPAPEIAVGMPVQAPILGAVPMRLMRAARMQVVAGDPTMPSALLPMVPGQARRGVALRH
ncbi:response regulator [Paragemmobacter ruber]|uniref:Response regulator n=1 Tax=Paragemmobacter ruber TaxID=1985673 RepID=A0ABW9Y306_9RHOB|nr:response regulator [Rhodobacter ruber]NBE06260.1 response regulator [Rhodobacter ruber]